MSWLRNDIPANTRSSPDSGESDAELVARAKHGDAQAFALLYRRYLAQVYSFTANRLNDREAAEDATQTIFLKAMQSLHTCRNEAHFAGWLFAIARNVIADSYRSGRVSLVTLDQAPEFEDPAAQPDTQALQAAWKDELAALRENCLKAKDRELLDMRLQGLTDREIAVALHRSQNTIRVAQFRLVQRLRKCLGIGTHTGEAKHADL